MLNRRECTAGLLATILLPASQRAAAQGPAYPDKPIRIIVASTAGSSPDTLARLLGEELKARLGQSFVVENRAGAGGVVGIEALAKSPPDGYTLGLGHDGTMAINTVLYRKLPYDPAKDFAAVAPLAINEFVLIASAGSNVRSVADFVKAVKAPGNAATYASAGIGTPNHVFMEQLLQRVGGSALHVPYRGGAAAATDVAGGQVQFMLAGLAPALPLINAGHVTALAVVQPTRSKMLPDVPTLSETLPDFALETWFGLFAPAGTPAAIVTRLGSEVRGILARPDFAEKLSQQGMTVKSGTAESLAEQVREDIARYRELATKIKLEAN